MLTILFAVLLIAVFGKLILVAIQMAWGIAKVLFTFILLPLALIGMFLGGLFYIALPILIVVGLISWLK